MMQVKEKVKKWSSGRVVGPALAELTLTYRCNLNCSFCNIPLDQESHTPASEIDFMPVVRQLSSNSPGLTFFLTGGEPLLRQDILALMGQIKKTGCEGLMVTNGTLFDEQDVKRVVDMGWDQLIFSIDGTERTHDRLRGSKGAFKSTVESIHLINNLKRQSKSNKPKIQLSTVLCQENLSDLEYVANLARRLKACLIDFSELRELTDAVSDLKVTAEEERVRRKLSTVRQILDKADIEHNLDFIIGEEPETETSEQHGSSGAPICYAPWYQISINPEGRVAPCSSLIDSEDYSFSLKGSSIWDIWKDKFNAVRKRMFTNHLPPECKNCCMPYEKQNKALKDSLTAEENENLRQAAFEGKEEQTPVKSSEKGGDNLIKSIKRYFSSWPGK